MWLACRCGHISRDGFKIAVPEIHHIVCKVPAPMVHYVKLRPVEVGGGFPTLPPKKKIKEEK